MRNVVLASTRWSLLLLSLLVGSKTIGHAQYTNGIYAEFNTSMGSFTCRLEYALAPKAVANFVGLATGQRAWLDIPSGVVKTNPFYNGTTFHRVIAGFMNQGGSPNGLGTDDPGYAFEDEFSPTLRHDSFGVLSSANSGPDSNGSQFFVTAGPTPWLNDVHTVFGKLYGGSNVVYAINHVVTGANDKPLTNILINSINIQRVGTAAQTFNIHAQGLPVVTNLNLRLSVTGAVASLVFSNRFFADNRLYSSTNLQNWAGQTLGIEASGAPANTSLQSAALPKRFFRAAQIQYASSTFAPKSLLGRTLTVNFTYGRSGTLVVNFNSSGGGTYTYNSSPGNLLGYNWSQQPYNGQLWPIGFVGPIDLDMTLKMNFTNLTSGTLTGTEYGPPFYYPYSPTTNVVGTISLSP